MDSLPQKKFNILLVGDSCSDEYRFGTVERISPEAPVPVFNYQYKQVKPGMAANVRENFKALGCNIECFLGPESTKTRFIDLRSHQHLLRVDDDARITHPLDSAYLKYKDIDAVVISDYNKGYITDELIIDIISRYRGPVFLDTKKTDLAKFKCIVKINELEFKNLTSVPENIIITLGRNGATWKGKKFPTKKVDVSDVCGAGDTFFASLVYFYLVFEKQMDKAIEFANRASSITVQQLGTYAPTMKEIYEA